MVERDEGGPDLGGILAIVFGVLAWVTFLVAFFISSDPFFFLLFAMVCGGVAIGLAVRARREETAAAAVGGAAAGAALLYGVSLVAILTAMIYATAVLMVLLVFLFLATAFSGSWACGSSSSSSSSGGGDPCCEDCCSDCGGACCECGCGDCGGCICGGCGDCGGCDCGGCGGCGCATLGLGTAALSRAPSWPGLQGLLARGLPHHPDAPEYREDVFVVRGARWCVGCFTTYPVFLLATTVLAFVRPPWEFALGLGALLAAAQGISSAGLAKRRVVKVAVKGALGFGLALVVAGVHTAPWPPAGKLALLLATLGLALLSALPRARRMAKARAARKEHQCAACAATPRTVR